MLVISFISMKTGRSVEAILCVCGRGYLTISAQPDAKQSGVSQCHSIIWEGLSTVVHDLYFLSDLAGLQCLSQHCVHGLHPLAELCRTEGFHGNSLLLSRLLTPRIIDSNTQAPRPSSEGSPWVLDTPPTSHMTWAIYSIVQFFFGLHNLP